MENKGIIKEIKGKDLYIELFRDSSCAHCSGCVEKDKTIKDLQNKLKNEADSTSKQINILHTSFQKI